jgi:hypothetical protein
VATFGKLCFENTGTLELSQTFQFVSGKTLQKIQNDLSIDRKCGTKKSADEGRARGDSGQN